MESVVFAPISSSREHGHWSGSGEYDAFIGDASQPPYEDDDE